ncbi:MAG: alpha/beta fold hydrolase [Reyranellaceae bacterium]
MSPKPALVMLPGLLNDRRVFGPQIAALQSRAAIVAPELWRVDTIDAMVDTVLAAAPPSFALCGFSMGGYVALEVFRRAPRRVRRLALIATTARGETPEGKKRREALIAQTRLGRWRGITQLMLPLLIHADKMKDKELVGVLQAMAMTVGGDGYVNQQRAIIGRRDNRKLLAKVNVPTIVIAGRDDQVLPFAMSEEIAAGIKGARLIALERCGHVAPLEQPAGVTAGLREWLLAGG